MFTAEVPPPATLCERVRVRCSRTRAERVNDRTTVEVVWGHAVMVLDYRIGERVRIVARGHFGELHAEGILRPAPQDERNADHARYELERGNADEPLALSLTRSETCVCTLTGSALVIDYGAVVVRVLWAP